MLDNKRVTKLGQKRYMTLVLRLLVDAQGDIHGTLVDLNEKSIGQFRGFDELPALIKDWLKKQQPPPDQLPPTPSNSCHPKPGSDSP